MKNKEIEELLDKLKDKDWYDELDLTRTRWIELKQEETNLLLSYIEQLEECYCNRTDCSSRIKDSKKYDSLLQKYEQLENNRNEAVREIMYMIENCDISYYQGEKLENILMGDNE